MRAALCLALCACASPRPAPALGAPQTTPAGPRVSQACRPGTPPGQSFIIASRVMGETRRINVFTPPGYDEGSARYPVLYMPDGGMEEDFPHVADAVLAGITWEKLQPLIIVGIENTERRRDMTGPTSVAEDRKIAPRVGGSAAFRKFIRDELMPEIRKRYRTTDETAIVGESLAGLFVVETFFLDPDMFDTYIAISPSVWWNGGSLIRGAGDWLRARPSLRKTLYLTSADESDIVSGLQQLARTLEAGAPAGLVWFYHPMPDQFHDTIYRASSPKAFRIVFARAAGTQPTP